MTTNLRSAFLLPQYLERHILDYLKLSNVSFKKIAAEVQRMSDFYIANPGAPTPWDENSSIAQMSYYLPLNYLRSKAVGTEGIDCHFFDQLDTLIEIGSGAGAASLALADLMPRMTRAFFIEQTEHARLLHQSLWSHSMPKAEWLQTNRPPSHLPGKRTVGLFSYSLVEISELPSWVYDLEAILIIEPSTREHGRKLLEWRERLINKGFFAWAPCVHQQNCPLLQHSKKDWCHDRIHWEQPAWFTKIEDLLPIKNQTITFSYLLMRKTKPSPRGPNNLIGRLTGDALKEKGKMRQLICRNTEREFVAWLKRDKIAQDLPRGILVHLSDNHECVGNEIRLKAPLLCNEH